MSGSVELEPRLTCGSFRYERRLGYPLLTPSTVAPELLLGRLCSSRGSFVGQVSVGVPRATPMGVAPEPLEVFLTPSRAILPFLMELLSISPFSKSRLFWKRGFEPLLPVLPFRGRDRDVLPVERASSPRDELLSGNPSENLCPVRGGRLQPGGVVFKAGLVRSGLQVSFDRVQQLGASLRGDSSRPSCPCLGYPQRDLEAGLVFDPSPGVPYSDTRGRPSNPSGGPVYAPSRFLLRSAPVLPCRGWKSCGVSFSYPLGAPF